ncbi:MAG: hypothetical protein AB7P04_12515 [Bacteriovoracia bacterium]
MDWRQAASRIYSLTLRKVGVAALLLTCAAVGIFLVGKLLMNAKREEILEIRLGSLEVQNSLVEEEFWRAIEKIRGTTVSVLNYLDQRPRAEAQGPGATQPQLTGELLLHWAELSISASEGLEIGRTARNPLLATRLPQTPKLSLTSPAPAADVSFEEFYLFSLKKKLSLEMARRSGVSLVRIKPDLDGHVEWLAIGFLVPVSQSNMDLKFVVALVDPAQGFPFLADYQKRNPGIRASLVSSDGVVLAHSEAERNGADVGTHPLYSDGIRKLFETNQEKGRGVFGRAFTAFVRPKRLPLSVVLEDSNGQDLSELEHLSTHAWLKLLLGTLFGVGAFAVIGAIWLAYRTSKANQTIHPAPSSASSATPGVSSEIPVSELPEMPVRPEGMARPAEIEALRREQARPQVRPTAKAQSKAVTPPVLTDELPVLTRREALEVVARFELNAQHFSDPRLIAAMLAQSASSLASSPVLYFRFNERTKLAILENDAGFPAGDAPAAIAFQVDPESVSQIQNCVVRRKLASLAHYEPVTRMLMERLGVAVFEAWAVTTPGPTPDVTTPDGATIRLHGILIILQSGVQSSIHRDALVHMMRSAGAAYERTAVPQIKVASSRTIHAS